MVHPRRELICAVANRGYFISHEYLWLPELMGGLYEDLLLGGAYGDADLTVGLIVVLAVLVLGVMQEQHRLRGRRHESEYSGGDQDVASCPDHGICLRIVLFVFGSTGSLLSCAGGTKALEAGLPAVDKKAFGGMSGHIPGAYSELLSNISRPQLGDLFPEWFGGHRYWLQSCYGGTH